MNFFESQDIAKRNTGRLIVLFALAIISLVLITNLLVLTLFKLIPVSSVSLAGPAPGFDWSLAIVVSCAVVAVVIIGSLYKLLALAGGGARVAEMLDGRLLLPDTDNLEERQLLNVVEEMALASGTPVPPVYLLDEPGINAFAAGYSPRDAVIGVTRGTLETLNRDELQGVVAHEFSHILHGDMRINIRLIAILHGILILGIVGYHLMRGGTFSRRSKESGGIVILGLGLLVIGYVGTFFGNLIKAAVSRQREFLADASAVQYTRNPNGIAGALMRIATHSQRSYLNNPNSMEISHALFEEGTFSRLSKLYATHPPIENRIQAILPAWDGDFDLGRISKDEQRFAQEKEEGIEGTEHQKMQKLSILASTVLADALVGQIGQPGIDQLATARQILANIPERFLKAAHDPSAARALVYLLVIDTNDEIRQSQLAFLEKSADQGIAAELHSLVSSGEGVASQFRLSLLSIALSSLKQLSLPQYERFSGNLAKLIRMDNKISLFEWALSKIVTNTLGPNYENNAYTPLGGKDITSCKAELEVLFTVLAMSDSGSKLDPKLAFEKAQKKLSHLSLDLEMRTKDELIFSVIDRALDRLAELKPLQKPAVLKACVACILADNNAAPIELELLRAIGATLDCPIPPLNLA